VVVARLAIAAVIASVWVGATRDARADHDDDEDPIRTPSESHEKKQPMLLLNAAPRIGSFSQIDKLIKVLDDQELLVHAPAALQEALEGRTTGLEDLDAIKEAYLAQDFKLAVKLLAADQERILKEGASGNPLPALAQIELWRGIVAVGQEDLDHANDFFRAAYRFDPELEPEPRLIPTRIRALVKKARTEPEETGKLLVEVDPSSATVQIDGGKVQPVGKKVELRVGLHVAQIGANGEESYAELVTIKQGIVETMQIALLPETKQSRAAKLVASAVHASPGPARLKPLREIAKAGGANRVLVIEDGGEDRLTVRVYDADEKKVSRQIDLVASAQATTIAHKVTSALDGADALAEAPSGEGEHEGHEGASHWYGKWYVWAGVAAVVGGGIAIYAASGHTPTSAMGF
jgi:hypothetical protein